MNISFQLANMNNEFDVSCVGEKYLGKQLSWPAVEVKRNDVLCRYCWNSSIWKGNLSESRAKDCAYGFARPVCRVHFKLLNANKVMGKRKTVSQRIS